MKRFIFTIDNLHSKDKELITELFLKGKSISFIRTHYSLSKETIIKVLKEKGIKIKRTYPNRDYSVRRFQILKNKDIKKYLNESFYRVGELTPERPFGYKINTFNKI